MSPRGEAGTPARTGTIHDQGYQRYQGTRLPQGRRFWVIARNVMATAWKSRWGVKLPVLGAGLTLVVAAGIMVVVGQLESRLGGRAGTLLRADAVLFYAQAFFGMWGLILAATVATAAVADDLRSGAFQFYFSRPLRAQDYVRGKVLGLLLLIGCATFVGPVTLALLRVFLVDDASKIVPLLPIVPKAILQAFAATAALALPAAGLGALLGRRAAAQAAYVVYWVVFASIIKIAMEETHQPLLGLLSLDVDVLAIGARVFGVSVNGLPSAELAGVAVAAFAGLGYLALRLRVRSAQSAGLGGG